MKTLILTPNIKLNCGMFQLAQDLAKEFDGEVVTRKDSQVLENIELNKINYDQIITFLYPMHYYGKIAKKDYKKNWVCYNQGIPPITKTYFPNFWRRQAMRYINWRNNATMEGADEYWDVTEREQKPRWAEKHKDAGKHIAEDFAIYIGRTTDYKNFKWLQKTMQELDILLYHPENVSDDVLHLNLSNARMLVTASIWEGWGRPVHEAESLGIPAVSFDTGAHKKNTKLGICVENHNFIALKEAIKTIWEMESKK